MMIGRLYIPLNLLVLPWNSAKSHEIPFDPSHPWDPEPESWANTAEACSCPCFLPPNEHCSAATSGNRPADPKAK